MRKRLSERRASKRKGAARGPEPADRCADTAIGPGRMGVSDPAARLDQSVLQSRRSSAPGSRTPDPRSPARDRAARRWCAAPKPVNRARRAGLPPQTALDDPNPFRTEIRPAHPLALRRRGGAALMRLVKRGADHAQHFDQRGGVPAGGFGSEPSPAPRRWRAGRGPPPLALEFGDQRVAILQGSWRRLGYGRLGVGERPLQLADPKPPPRRRLARRRAPGAPPEPRAARSSLRPRGTDPARAPQRSGCRAADRARA